MKNQSLELLVVWRTLLFRNQFKKGKNIFNIGSKTEKPDRASWFVKRKLYKNFKYADLKNLFFFIMKLNADEE